MSWYTCSDCDYMNLRDKNSYGETYCSERMHYYDPADTACNKFRRGGRYIGSDSACYLTTAVCDILGYPDNCNNLELLRAIRDTYMAKEVDCYDLLKEYKSVGPQICEKLYNDPFKETIAESMLENYIKPAISEFKENPEESVNIYIEMTNTLIKHYNVKDKNEMLVRTKKDQ